MASLPDYRQIYLSIYLRYDINPKKMHLLDINIILGYHFLISLDLKFNS